MKDLSKQDSINSILRIIGETVISLLTIKYARILHRKQLI